MAKGEKMIAANFTTPEERQTETDRIRTGMLKQEYFVVHRESLVPKLKEEARLEHYHWLIELEKRGDILLSGSVTRKDGTRAEGMTILRAGSFEEAEALAASDPTVINGATSFRIERFALNVGRFTVSLNFSDKTYQID